MESLEIEFKTLLTKQNYEKLQQDLQLPAQEAVWQKNYYFDTYKTHLKHRHCSLRLREFTNSGELTLKVPQSSGKLEITDLLTSEQVAQIASGKFLKQGAVADKLAEFRIHPAKLSVFGQLETWRNELLLPIGLLALDRSVYYGFTDYELELEVENEAQGAKDFAEFLKKYQIPDTKAKSKIQRMLFGKNFPGAKNS
ncbi:CYTH domain-containing protein [Enterococcus timonensis]|uniref:CYTH domain-containing protein n=1 Tax=Enterococcus timonensis TaxID=1852364 RepID=UPI0008DAA7D3|nr:CYTH domain-containing protein [Enterococcus timonensis]